MWYWHQGIERFHLFKSFTFNLNRLLSVLSARDQYFLLFSELISMPYFVAIVSNRRVRSASSSWDPAIKSMSSAKRRLLTFLPYIFTVPSKFSSDSVMICSRKRLNKHGDSGLPCLTPTVGWKGSLLTPPIWTVDSDLSYRALMMSVMDLLMLCFSNTATYPRATPCWMLSWSLWSFDVVFYWVPYTSHI